MITLLTIIDQMQEKFGATYDKQEMPKWMAEMQMKFLQTDNFNIKLFILKVILNKPEPFEPYKHYWVRHILKAIAGGLVGENFNYYLRDICILLLRWNVVPQTNTEDRAAFSNFMVSLHLMKFFSYF
jgi:hypothetical protein